MLIIPEHTHIQTNKQKVPTNKILIIILKNNNNNKPSSNAKQTSQVQYQTIHHLFNDYMDLLKQLRTIKINGAKRKTYM